MLVVFLVNININMTNGILGFEDPQSLHIRSPSALPEQNNARSVIYVTFFLTPFIGRSLDFRQKEKVVDMNGRMCSLIGLTYSELKDI